MFKFNTCDLAFLKSYEVLVKEISFRNSPERTGDAIIEKTFKRKDILLMYPWGVQYLSPCPQHIVCF